VFWIFAGAGIVAYNFLVKQFSNDDQVLSFRAALMEAERNFNRANTDWQSRAGPETFLAAKRKFEACRTDITEIPIKRNSALEQLRQSHRKLQLDRYLDRFEIEDAKIKGIGPGRKERWLRMELRQPKIWFLVVLVLYLALVQI
jgi:hypothetical protein